MKPLRGSLVGRITLAGAAAAALAGTGSALSAGITGRELVSAHDVAVHRAAALELAEEVREEVYGEDDDEDSDEDSELRTFPDALAHELEDVKLPGARAAIDMDGERVAGDPTLPRLTRDGCESLTREGVALRACSVPLGDAEGKGRVILVAEIEGELTRKSLFTRALWLGLLSGALLGALSSYLLARWAIAPLSALRDRVRALRVDDTRPELLGPPATQLEVEELRAAVASLVERLGSALEHAQAFAAEAAHELRTPLTMLAGELELLAAAGAEPDPEAVARVRAQVRSLTALVQRLLVLAQPARIAAEQAEVVDLADVLESVAAELPPDARARLAARCADDVIVSGDATLLRVLLSNALENALKFSTGPVELTIEAVGDEAHIDVRDQGPGVPEAERARVFEAFYRSPQARAGGAPGHGLGLALIAKVAFRHGGRVEFLESARGAHLRIVLPRWKARA